MPFAFQSVFPDDKPFSNLAAMQRITAIICIFLLLTSSFTALSVWGQDFFDTNDSNFSGDNFQDSDDFAIPDDFQSADQIDDPFTEPDPAATEEDAFGEEALPEEEQYVDEEQFSDESENFLRLNILDQERLNEQEKVHMISNVAYGAGTGAMIGLWFAFLRPGTSRDQFRTIGTSTVLGGIIGSLMGSRSFWNPGGPRPTGVFDQTSETNLELLANSRATFPTDMFHLTYVWKF